MHILKIIARVLGIGGVCLLALAGCGSQAGSEGSAASVSEPVQPSEGTGNRGTPVSPDQPVDADGHFPPRANGAWLYDVNDFQDKQAGMWAQAINEYNSRAAAGHKITLLYSYGGDMEMYCERKNPTLCTPNDLKIYYSPTGGYASTAAYAAEVVPDGKRIHMAPVIDGAIGSPVLKGFDRLSVGLARAYADKVAQRICSDEHVDGVEFDLEPFHLSDKNGEYYFYMQIARDFSGHHDEAAASDPYLCVDANHPEGRFFAVFASAHALKPGSASADNVQAIMSRGNGYFIASLYDLSSRPGGSLSSVESYTQAVAVQVLRVKIWAHALGIPYAFGVPGAASAHEYTHCVGDTACRTDQNGASGHDMLDYTQAAIAAIDASGARDDPKFIGNDLWYWGSFVRTGGSRVSPSTPSDAVLNYLGNRL